MNKNLLEAGKIVNTFGTKGEVKIQPWADTPEFLTEFGNVFIDAIPVKILSARIHKGCVIAALEGVTDINTAISLKNKIIYIDRDKVELEQGQYFVADLIGIKAIDAQTGEPLGTISDVLALPTHNVYVVKGAREILVPAVSDFVKEIDINEGVIKLRLIEGM